VVYEGTSTRDKLYRMPKRYRVRKAMQLEATAYYPGPEDTGKYADGLTATNQRAGYGVAAVDPRVIRMKTPLYIEGYGFAWAADVGGAIKGRHIDLCFNTYEEAVRYGRKDVQVYILR
jgi:3D (Asp-Asp-Asp) domain-containing protein